MNKFFLALSIAALSAAPLTAAAQSLSAEDVLYRFDDPMLGQILTENEIEWSAQERDGMADALLATAPSGYKFFLFPTACGEDGTNCVGLNMIGAFESDASDALLNELNFNYAFASVGRDISTADQVLVNRYEICDHGILKDNLALSIQTFIGVSENIRAQLYSSSQ